MRTQSGAYLVIHFHTEGHKGLGGVVEVPSLSLDTGPSDHRRQMLYFTPYSHSMVFEVR